MQEQTNSAGHWQNVYSGARAETLGWYAPHLEHSLALIKQFCAPAQALIDAGGGASTLADDLLEAGYRDVTVLDIAPAAVAASQRRLGQRASGVQWLTGDLLSLNLPQKRFHLWHDRAVFHFLTKKAQRLAYIERLGKALLPGGHVVIATFGPQGPTMCSGLPAMRYSAEKLAQSFGGAFSLQESKIVTHRMPSGLPQEFLYAHFTYPA